jgi:hypothetical protein
MAPNKRSFEGVEINGIFVDIFLEAFKLFPSVVYKRLLNYGIGTLQGKDVVIDRNAWYPLDKWLPAHEDIAASVGPRASFSIGQQIPKILGVPPGVTDAHGALSTLNAGYHLNHRKNGQIMFDPSTGAILPGIGDLAYTRDTKQKGGTMVSDDPYPCDLDRGLITGLVQRFERHCRIAHDERACRRNGGTSCTYSISW